MHFCITGGSKGLGRALSLCVLLNNHKLTIIDKADTDLKCSFIKHDFSEYLPSPVSCDVLIICHATFDGFAPFSAHPREYFKKYLQINLLSQIDLIKRSRYKKLVYINSVLSIAPVPNASLYTASKSFMHSFLESLRREGVPLLLVYPYKIDTDLFKSVRSPYVLKKKQISAQIFDAIVRGHTHLYLPSIFRYAYIFSLFPTFLQDILMRLISYAMVEE